MGLAFEERTDIRVTFFGSEQWAGSHFRLAHDHNFGLPRDRAISEVLKKKDKFVFAF